MANVRLESHIPIKIIVPMTSIGAQFRKRQAAKPRYLREVSLSVEPRYPTRPTRVRLLLASKIHDSEAPVMGETGAQSSDIAARFRGML